MMSRLVFRIILGALALQVGNLQAHASPCPGQACFELVADASTTSARNWDESGEYINKVYSAHYLTFNARRFQLHGYSFAQPIWKLKATLDRNTLAEGSNFISLNFTGVYLIGVTASLRYWGPNASSSLHVCSNQFTNSTVNNVSCSMNLSLNELDPAAVAEINALKQEAQGHRDRIKLPNQTELDARARETAYENERNEIQTKLDLLNQELQNLNFADFDTLSPEAMAQLISEDLTIRDLYHQLKATVDQVKATIQAEVQSNRNKVQQASGSLHAQFGNLEGPQVHFHFDPPADGVGAGAGRAAGRADHEGIPAFHPDISHAGQAPAGHQAAGLGYFESVTQQAITRLDAALRDGDRGLFFSIFKAWQSQHDQTFHALQQGRATGATLDRMRQAQHRILDFVGNRIDLYGFFREVRIPDSAKQIAGEKLKQWDEGLSRDLLEELNGWQSDLNPAQQKVLESIDLLGRLLDRMADPRMHDLAGDPQREEAKELTKTIVKISVESLIRSAHAASGSSAEDQAEALEILEEVNAGLQLAVQLADIALGMIPGVGAVKDFYEAITGKNLLTGEALSFNERVFSTLSGTLSLFTLGSSNFLKGPLKIFGKVAKKGLPVARTAQRAHQVEEVTREVKRIADSARNAGLQSGEKTTKFFGNLRDFIKDEAGSLDLGKAAEFMKSQAGKILAESPFNLRKTHQLTKGKAKFAALKQQIAQDGQIREAIKYVEYNGEKYIVDGHHRVRAAMELGIKEVPVEKVNLPYKGYETINDLLNW